MIEPYNPLDKIHLGESVATAILRQPPLPLPLQASFDGAGVYVIYYTGDFPSYGLVAKENRNGKYNWPIYVGKAIPKGGRRAGIGVSESVGPVTFKRLLEHSESIRQTENLKIEDFSCRHLIVDDIWIPLGESLLIQRFRPVWNMYIDGFGNHDPGSGRYNQKRSPWDILHPGRSWAMKCAVNPRTEEEIRESLQKSIDDHMKMKIAESKQAPKSQLPSPRKKKP